MLAQDRAELSHWDESSERAGCNIVLGVETDVLTSGRIGLVRPAVQVELDRESVAGIPVEEHARHAGTINYELTTGIVSDPRRAERRVVGG